MNRLPGTRSLNGFSLLEVLIALLVLAVGLLGIAALQGVALKTNQGAYLRSQATFLAYDMMDRMRANRLSAMNGNYDLTMAASPGGGSSLAEQDLQDWIDNYVSQLLPAGDGEVSCVDSDGLPGNEVCTITVQWDEARLGGTATAASDIAQFSFTAEI